MKILGIIPARGGSKGIPQKNILSIKGKPLIAYSIEIGLNAVKKGYLNKVIVSTDDKEIAEIASKYGDIVPFLRPAVIADDKAKSISFVEHALDYFDKKGENYDAVMILQPTSPLRKLEDIQKSIQIINQSQTESLISVYKEDYINSLVMYKMDENNIGVPLNENHNKGVRRQEHQSVYIRNGAIYIIKKELIQAGLLIADIPAIYVMPKERSVNLDTIEDVKLLEYFI